MDRRIDTAVAAAFMMFGIFVILQATTIKTGLVRDPVGPRAAFYFAGGMMAVGGFWLVLRNLLAFRREAGKQMQAEGSQDEPSYPASFKRAAFIMISCILYGAVFVPLGYLLATPLFLLATLFILEQRAWLTNVMVAFGFTVIAYFVFSEVLGVRMPYGPLTGPLRELGWITL